MARVLVTGACGFIGSELVRQLLADGQDELVLLDQETYAASRERLDGYLGNPRVLAYYRGDICDEQLVRDLFRIYRIEGVYHTAAASHVDRSIESAEEFVRTNVVGTQVLLDAAREHQVQKFVLTSTDEVYGPLEAGAAGEENPLRPRNPYSASKASADLLCQSYFHTHGLPVVITRGANTFGAFQFPEKFLPTCITRILTGRKIPLYGDGKQEREWIHVRDHASALVKVFREGIPGEAYNVGTGTRFTNREVAARVVSCLKPGQPGWTEQVDDRPGHDRRYAVNSTKLQGLGWKPERGFQEDLEATVRWYQDHRDWWEPKLADRPRDVVLGEAQPAPTSAKRWMDV